jgi:transcriptional regulator with XRE-family HTH domain
MSSWFDILRSIIKSPSERQRLSTALGVTPMTLTRWASGESKPQRSHLVHLLQVLHANQRAEIIDALQQAYPELPTLLNEGTVNDTVPAEFFAQVLNLRTITTEGLRFWRISECILKQALAQLDPNQLGMSVKLLQCMPPIDPHGNVRSLRERTGKGNPPWTSDLEQDVLFLGIESLSGAAVETRHAMSNDNLQKNRSTPANVDEFEVSAAAHPIRLEGRIAGCLLASSAQESYFSQQRIELLATFSDLLSLAFNREDFYAPERITLRVMPKPEKQRVLLADYRTLVTQKFHAAMQQQKQLTNAEAEMLAWQDFEEILIKEQERQVLNA